LFGHNGEETKTGVLHTLKASLSRSSLSQFGRKISGSSLRRPSSKNLSVATSISPPVASPPSGIQVYKAQTSEYWSGRFVSLHDRFHNELLTDESLAIITEASKPKPPKQNSHRLLHLSGSRTMANLTHNAVHREAELLSDDDNRCRRVFLHLDALCATDEAKRSLHVWQQDYARRTGRECLLPPRGAMEDRGLMQRLFSGGKIIGSMSNNSEMTRGRGKHKRFSLV
jgi:hypothetical protein